MDSDKEFHNVELERIIQELQVNTAPMNPLDDLIRLCSSVEECTYYFKQLVDRYNKLNALTEFNCMRMFIYINILFVWKDLLLKCTSYLLELRPDFAKHLEYASGQFTTQICTTTSIDVTELLIGSLRTEKDIDNSIKAFENRLKPKDTYNPWHDKPIMKLFEQQRQVIKRRYCKAPL